MSDRNSLSDSLQNYSYLFQQVECSQCNDDVGSNLGEEILAVAGAQVVTVVVFYLRGIRTVTENTKQTYNDSSKHWTRKQQLNQKNISYFAAHLPSTGQENNSSIKKSKLFHFSFYFSLF